MSAAPKLFLTPAEYLRREEQAAFKSEYFHGEMFAMAGASPEHNAIEANLGGRLFAALDGGRCRTVGSNQRVKIDATGLYTYPDLSVLCDPPEYETIDGVQTLVNPTMIVEVLSDSTENYDRTTKFDHYRRIASLREYVLVSQRRPRVERFVRQSDDNWTYFVHEGLDATVEFASIPVRIPLAQLYRHVEFPPAGPAVGA